MFFCSPGYAIIYERGANAETMVRSAAAEAEQKGLSDFSRLWYALCTANSRAQDADEPLGRQQASSLRAAFDAVSPSPGLSGRASGAMGPTLTTDAALA